MSGIVNLDNYLEYEIVSTTSKGASYKWLINGLWYKLDIFGYDALAEYICSKLLAKSNISNFCKYDIVTAMYKGKEVTCSVSSDFRSNNSDSVITLHRLYQLNDIGTIYLDKTDIKSSILHLVNTVEHITGLTDFGKYLTAMLEFDTFVLNEDRHFQNIAVIKDIRGNYKTCPLYDFGLSLISDIREYSLFDKYTDNIQKVKCLPFHSDFDTQLSILHELYGRQLYFDFDKEYVDSICKSALSFYRKEYVDRVHDVLIHQMERYPGFFNNHSDMRRTSLFE